jgi:hypothetical protein
LTVADLHPLRIDWDLVWNDGATKFPLSGLIPLAHGRAAACI